MEEGNDKTDVREEIFSKAVRAGKRTYFFDVKVTRKNEYYLTITESKKRYSREGQAFYEKHKVFLYKEDFDKFLEGLTETTSFILENQPVIEEEEPVQEPSETVNAKQEESPEVKPDPNDNGEMNSEDFTSVEFEDLDDKSE